MIKKKGKHLECWKCDALTVFRDPDYIVGNPGKGESCPFI